MGGTMNRRVKGVGLRGVVQKYMYTCIYIYIYIYIDIDRYIYI